MILTSFVPAFYQAKISDFLTSNYDAVFGYFQSETNKAEQGNEEISVFTVSKRKTIGEAAGDKKRRDTIQSVIHSTEFDVYVTASQKGALSIYNGKLRLQNCFDTNESAWMTSCQYLPKLRKIIATTERSIIIWDHRAKAKNHASVHVIKPLEHSPQCMCIAPSDDDHSDSVLIGDDAGYVNLLRLTHNDFAVKANKDPKNLMKYHVIDPASLTIPVVRRRFHHDWVLQIQYLPDLKSVACCSPSDKISFVIANFKRLFDAQPVSELSIPRGVNAFCYSEKSNIFATGGVDKTIRVWHPNILSRPTGKMVGHLFTIVEIVMNEKDQHVISLSTARVFRVWDSHTLACLQVFTSSDDASGDRRISAMLFDARHDRLITGSNTLDLWPMTRTVQDTMSIPHTHDHPLATVVVNAALCQVITICTESIIKVWEVETGRQMYHIFEAHGPNVEVVSAAVDDVGMRMITGAYDGSLKVWEFSSGQEMKFYAFDDAREDDHSVIWIEYLCDRTDDLPASEQAQEQAREEEQEEPERKEAAKEPISRRVLALGWNNQLKIFQDDDDSPELVLTFVFDGMFEWPLVSAPSTPVTTVSPTGGETNDDGERKRIAPAPPVDEDGEEAIRRKEDVLLGNEMTCCRMCNEAELARTLVTGCSNGNLILWDLAGRCVGNVFELAKAELASSYDSHRHRAKDQYPHRTNDVAVLCHKIYRPDPEEVKRRKKLMKKNMREEQGLEDEDNSEDGDSEAEKKVGGGGVEENGEEQVAGNNPDESDPAEEAELDIEGSDEDEDESQDEEEERRLAYGIDSEPIKMVEVKFPPVIASCHQDTFVRLWSTEGELLCSLNAMTRVLSPFCALCSDEHANQLMAADAKGYITVWDVSEFLERSPASLGQQGRTELIKQVVCWRAHLAKVVALAFVNLTRVIISASTDGSVRVWYPQRGHYIGYFGQHRVWHITPNPSLPSSPVLPYDITEGPLNPVHARSSRRKPQAKKYDCPLVFDADRWRPFRRSAYARDAAQRNNASAVAQQSTLNVIEIRNKKFFSALVKPKADKSSLESDKPVDSDTGAIFHHLPVYRIKTPPPQPKPLNLGYEIGWGDGSSDSAKTGHGGAGRAGGKHGTGTGPGAKARRTGIGRKNQQHTGASPSRRR